MQTFEGPRSPKGLVVFFPDVAELERIFFLDLLALNFGLANRKPLLNPQARYVL